MQNVFTTQRLEVLLPRIHDFVSRELIPLESSLSFHHLEGLFPILDEKRHLVKAAGLWGLHLPASEGGLGLSLCEFGQVSEALAKAPFFGHYVFGCQAPDIGNVELLQRFASPDLQARYLRPLLEGTIRSCFAMTEPEYAGSNPTRLGTTAVREGDEYILNGHKWFTSSADGAAFAIVMAVTQPDAAPHERASMILVPTDTPGFEQVRNISVFGEAGFGWMSHAELRFTECRVPVSHLIGAEGTGFRLAQERLGPGRIHHCMRWIGIAEKAFDLMCRRAASREVGEGKALGDQQFVQGWIAKSRIDIDAARLLVLHTAHLIDLYGAAAVREQISGIKYFAANMMLQVLDRAIQVHGALGLTDDLMLSMIYRHERGARIWDGADEVHLQSISRSVLKRYRQPE